MAGNVDRRRGDGDKWPIWRREIGTVTMANGGVAQGTTSDSFNGIIGTIIVVLPDSTNGVTTTLSITDEDSYELYSRAALADNQTHVLTGVDILAAGNLTFGMTASGDPGADWVATLAAYGV
jgi:FlaG/FlaF family flagellin (archaellin)